MRYLDPKNDLTFKKIFGTRPHLLKSFLNALLPLDEDHQIVSLEYLPAELVPAVPLLKNTIVDVRCKDVSGRSFIVEMQMLWTDSFKYRVLFNASKAYVRQLEKGEEYRGLQPVYALSLVNEIFENKIEEFYHHYSIVHSQYPKKKLEGLEFVFVELPKFKPKHFSEKKLMVLWLRFLTEIKDGSETIDHDLMENPLIKEAVGCLQESSFSKEELLQYDKYWDSVSSEKTLIEEAEAKGIEKGEKIGFEKGENQGIQLTLNIIKLFQEGNDIGTIASRLEKDISFVKDVLLKAGFEV